MIRASQLSKHYHMGDSTVRALDGVDLHIPQGQFVSIIGSSGSGKSTLMHIIGCLDHPTSGTIEIHGQDVNAMSEKRMALLRNNEIGFVFQTFNLISRTTALDNVVVPLMYTRKPFTTKPAIQALERVGLSKRIKHRPSEMSGGECQRVAIARAIVNKPKLLLADEPTGNLDTHTGTQIMNIVHELHTEGMTVVLVTHEMDIAVQAERMIEMKDGKIVADTAVDAARRSEILKLNHEAHQSLFRKKSMQSPSSKPLPPQMETK